jgi:predicted PurR-regulated permease PerM
MMLGFDRDAARVTWTAWAVTILLYGLYLAAEAVFVFVLAVFLAYALWPPAAFLQRHSGGRLSRTEAIAIVFLALIAAAALAFVLLGVRVVDEGMRLAQQIPRLKDDTSWISTIPLPSWLEIYRPRIETFLRDHIATGASQVTPFLRKIARHAFEVAGNLLYVVLVPIIAFLLVKDAPVLHSGALQFVNPAKVAGMATPPR